MNSNMKRLLSVFKQEGSDKIVVLVRNDSEKRAGIEWFLEWLLANGISCAAMKSYGNIHAEGKHVYFRTAGEFSKELWHKTEYVLVDIQESCEV